MKLLKLPLEYKFEIEAFRDEFIKKANSFFVYLYLQNLLNKVLPVHTSQKDTVKF